MIIISIVCLPGREEPAKCSLSAPNECKGTRTLSSFHLQSKASIDQSALRGEHRCEKRSPSLELWRRSQGAVTNLETTAGNTELAAVKSWLWGYFLAWLPVADSPRIYWASASLGSRQALVGEPRQQLRSES